MCISVPEIIGPLSVVQGECLGRITTGTVNIKGKLRLTVEHDWERLMKLLGRGEQYVRNMIADKEMAGKWLNGKEIKKVFI